MIYGVFSITWILVTDQINYLISPDVRYATLIAIIKGLAFVLASTFLIYALLKIDERQERSLRSELQSMQESFSSLFDDNPLPMWVNDVDEYRFLAVNKATAKMFGFSAEGLPSGSLGHICQDLDRDKLLLAAGKHFEGIHNTGPWHLTDASGASILVNLILVRFNYAKRPALLVTLVDMSRQREIEESLRRTADERDAFESFSYSIAHDLRANIRAVSGYSQVLLEDYGPRLDEQAKTYMQRMKEASEQMTGIIDRMLMLSQLDHKNPTQNWVNLSEIVMKCASNHQHVDPGRSVKFVIEPDVYATVDAELMTAALTNLVENAWKFTSTCPDAVIEFGKSKGTKGADTFFVRDNGVGFDAASAVDLFKPFQRFHPQADFPGSGIGLSIVARIIQRHGGKIWAESEPGKGATFFFTLEKRSKES
jgi:PAS domain S-box-containing protein